MQPKDRIEEFLGIWYTGLSRETRQERPFDFDTYWCVCAVWAEMRWALGGMDEDLTARARLLVSLRYFVGT